MNASMIASVNTFRNESLNSARTAFNAVFTADQSLARATSDSARAAARVEKYGDAAPKGDRVNISEAALRFFNEYTSQAPSGREAAGASMRAMTAFGTLVEVEARAARGGGRSIAAGFLRPGDGNGSFHLRLAGVHTDQQNVPMTYSVRFTHADGEIQEFALDGNTAFRELDDGSIVRDAAGGSRLTGSDGRDILIVLDDATTVDAGEGDDIIFNMGRKAALRGGDGNDVITSLGDETVAEGGAGDDAIAMLHDTIRSSLDRKASGEETDREQAGLEERPRASQRLTVDGGDGNDHITVRPDLYQGVITGGSGADTIRLNNATSSTIDGGDGSDSIVGNDLFRSVVLGRAGNDMLLFRDLHKSSVSGGDGNDWIEIRDAVGSALSGGDGDDVIVGRDVRDTLVDAGNGRDVISLGSALGGSIVSGGDGDDVIFVDTAGRDSQIGGGSGNDVIVTGSAGLVDGGDGDDTLIVGGAHTVTGGSGNDRIVVGVLEEDGLLDGGDGDDLIHVDQAYGGSLVSGGSGDDVIRVDVLGSSRATRDNGRVHSSPVGAVVDGGAGNDVIRVGHAYAGSLVYGGGGAHVPSGGNAGDRLNSRV